MSAYTGDEALLHLVDLFKTAYDLIKSEKRNWYETKELFNALQWYKDETLGRVEPKLSAEVHGKMFCEAMRGSRRAYERLLDSLTEFGVDGYTIGKLKSGESLLELGRINLTKLHSLVSVYPMEHVVGNAFRQIQKKMGIEKPVWIPAIVSKERERFEKLVEVYSGPPQE